MRSIICVAALVVCVGSAAPARAQCYSWATGFGRPGNGIDGNVHCLLVYNDGSGPSLFASGNFQNAGAVAAMGIAKWNGTGWSALGSGASTVISMVPFDDGTGTALYAAGQFTVAGGVPALRAAKWNGSSWSALGSGLDNNASCLAVYDGGTGLALYVGGDFLAAGGSATDRIASWNGSTWRTWSGGPSARTGHAMAYDAARSQVVLFGGTTNGNHTGALGDTWVWDGATWSRVATMGPLARFEAEMTYDSLRQRVVLFGGKPLGWGGGVDSSTWAWNGTSWSQIAAAVSMPGRTLAPMAYDAARDRVLLFGGQSNITSTTYYDQTWVFDGTAWSQGSPATVPVRRAMHGMAYDAGRGRTVMFGGYNPTNGELGDTWEWDGTNWTQVATSGPSARYRPGMAYDSLRGRVVVFGGIESPVPRDTWAWDGTSWTQLIVGSQADPGHAAAMVYDAARDRMIQRTASPTSTWAFDGTAWALRPAGGPNNTVSTMVVFDDGTGPALYVGGTFTQVAGAAAPHIAKWNGTTWSPLPTGPNGTVNTLAVYNDGTGAALYAGGNFSFVGNTQAANVARWSGTAWSALGTHTTAGGVDSPVNSLAVFDDGSGSGPALFVGGSFTSADNQVVSPKVAKWSGAGWSVVGAGFQGVNTFGALALAGYSDGVASSLFAGGSFTQAGGVASEHIARWIIPCSPPTITQQPVDATAVFNNAVVFTVGAAGTTPLSYQWRHNGAALSNGSPIQGADTPTLMLTHWSLSDAGDYDCVVTNPVGTATSNAATLTVPVYGSSGQAVSVTTIVVPPQPVPGSAGTNFTSFGSPAQSSTGEVAFYATYNDGTMIPPGSKCLGIWEDDTAGILCRVGDPAPGTETGVTFAQPNSGIEPFTNWVVGANGQVCFMSDLSGPGIESPANRRGIWYRDLTGTDLVARNGSAAGGISGPVFMTLSQPNMNDSGLLAFYGRLTGPVLDAGLWTWTRAGGQSLVARIGDSAPDTSTTFRTFGDPPLINSAGHLAIGGTLNSLTGYAYSTSFDSGIWLGTTGSLQLVAKSGDAAPGAPEGTNLELMVSAAVNGNDEVAMVSRIAGPGGYLRHGLYRWGDGTLTPVIVPDQAAPGAGAGSTFFAPTIHAFNNAGTIVFDSNMATTCQECPSTGVWIVRSGQIIPVALNRGYPGYVAPPDMPPGFKFGGTGPVALNNSDQAVFSFSIGPSETGYNGVYGWTATHGLFPIAAPGSQLEVASGQYRTVSNAYLANVQAGVTGVASSSLTDSGRVVFAAGFTDGSTGLFAGQFVDFFLAYFPCPPDYDHNGLAEPADVALFVGTWFESLVQGTLAGDYDQNGQIQPADIAVFVTDWFAAAINGC